MPKKTLGDIGSRPRRPIFLRAYRKRLKLSQGAAGEKIGVSYTTVGRKERGANVDHAYLEAAAKAYGCEPGDFFKQPIWLTAGSEVPDLAKIRSVFDHVLIGLDEEERKRQKAQSVQETPPQSGPVAPIGGPKSAKKSRPPRRP